MQVIKVQYTYTHTGSRERVTDQSIVVYTSGAHSSQQCAKHQATDSSSTTDDTVFHYVMTHHTITIDHVWKLT